MPRRSASKVYEKDGVQWYYDGAYWRLSIFNNDSNEWEYTERALNLREAKGMVGVMIKYLKEKNK